ncbi:catalase [Fusarium beomiforme]|uniref:Catalase n=1 Tax=Fusarium beomiforme TaxID=44412 RepID=A0A9P5AM54_9HYPO|nr:catalase [Fusarium beomiforme]
MSKLNEPPVYTLAEGKPIEDPTSSVVLRGPKVRGGGLALLADTQLIETLAHFPRERIPERVVHAKAAGAGGYFECTHDITDWCSAAPFRRIGKQTLVLVRLSTVAGEKGSSDTTRDIRGFAFKMKTEEGNWDFVGNDLPVFFIRDPAKFPSLNRSHKRHPQTAVADASMFWDFHNNNQEGAHCLMQLFGPRGVPASLRNVNGFGNHTFKFGKPEDGSFKYVKIHFKPDDGIKNLSEEDAVRLAGEEPDYHIKDMYNSIERGDYPTWTMYLQVMEPKEAETYKWNIFDITKIWPHKDYPLIPVGKLVLDKNPDNHFHDIEQAAFSPSTLIPGIAPSADIMLHARMFSYPDAARYRVGPNYQQLPCNRPLETYSPYQRDGPMRLDGNYGSDPDYVRSSFRKIKSGPADVAHSEWVGKVQAYSSDVTEEDWEQPRNLWKIFKDNGDDEVFLHNLSAHVNKALPEVQKETVRMWANVDEEIAKRLDEKLKELGEEFDHSKAPPTLDNTPHYSDPQIPDKTSQLGKVYQTATLTFGLHIKHLSSKVRSLTTVARHGGQIYSGAMLNGRVSSVFGVGAAVGHDTLNNHLLGKANDQIWWLCLGQFLAFVSKANSAISISVSLAYQQIACRSIGQKSFSVHAVDSLFGAVHNAIELLNAEARRKRRRADGNETLDGARLSWYNDALPDQDGPDVFDFWISPRYKCEKLARCANSTLKKFNGRAAPFNLSRMITEGWNTYYSIADEGDYAEHQIEHERYYGRRLQKLPLPQTFGAFKTEPVIWLGRVTVDDVLAYHA